MTQPLDPTEPVITSPDGTPATSSPVDPTEVIKNALKDKIDLSDPRIGSFYAKGLQDTVPPESPDTVADVGRGVINAPFDMAQGASDAYSEAVGAVTGTSNKVQIPTDRASPFDPEKTGAGVFVNRMTQNMIAIAVTHTMVPLTAVPAESSFLVKALASPYVRNAAAIGVSDAVAYKPNDKLLANLLFDSPGDQKSLMDYLAADKESPALLNRLRAGVEGAVSSLAVDGVLKTFSIWKQARKAGLKGGEKAVAEVLADNKDTLEQAQRVIGGTNRGGTFGGWTYPGVEPALPDRPGFAPYSWTPVAPNPWEGFNNSVGSPAGALQVGRVPYTEGFAPPRWYPSAIVENAALKAGANMNLTPDLAEKLTDLVDKALSGPVVDEFGNTYVPASDGSTPITFSNTQDLSTIGKGMASGITDNMYHGMLESLQNGTTKFAGVEDPFLRRAKPFFDDGRIKTAEDLRAFANDAAAGGRVPIRWANAGPGARNIGELDANTVLNEWATSNGVDLKTVPGLDGTLKNINEHLAELRKAATAVSEVVARPATLKVEPIVQQAFKPGDRTAILSSAAQLMKSGATAQQTMDEVFMSLKALNISNDAKLVQNAAAEIMSDALESARGTTTDVASLKRANEVLARLADTAGTSAPSELDKASAFAPKLTAYGLSFQQVLAAGAKELSESIASQAAGTGAQSDLLHLLVKIDTFGKNLTNSTRFFSGVARALRTRQIPVNGLIPASVANEAEQLVGVKGLGDFLSKDGIGAKLQIATQEGLNPKDVLDEMIRKGVIKNSDVTELLVKNGGEQNIRQLAVKIAQSGGDPGRLRKVLQANDGIFRKILNVVNEGHIAALLSNPTTLIANGVSNTLKSFVLPLEQMLGATLSGDFASIKDAAATLVGITRFTDDSWRMLKVSVMDEASSFDRQFSTNELHRKYINSSYLGLTPNTGLAKTVDAIGKFVRMPMNLMTSMDAVFKFQNFRAIAERELTKNAFEAGMKTPDEVAQFVASGMKLMEDPKAIVGSALEPIYTKALTYARDASFQTPLTGFAKTVQDAVNKYPVMRLFLPFIRTPTNLVRDVVMRTPVLGQLQKQWWSDILAGGARRSNAVGKLATGSLLWTTAVGMAMSGKVTGAGPQDPQKRNLLRQAGWQPYSFVVPQGDGTNKYISYNRLDPVAMIFGIASNAHEIAQASPGASLEELTASGVFAATKTVEDRTMLKGIADLIEATKDPSKAFRFGQQFIAGFVPSATNVVPDDDYIRETTGIFDAALAKLPGVSGSLPAKYDAVGRPLVNTGKQGFNVITPFKTTESTKDPVYNELVKLDTKFSPPSANYGVDWRSIQAPDGSTAYDALNKEYGSVTIGGRDLNEALAVLIKSSSYKSLPESVPGGEPTGRIAAIRGIMLRYQDLARKNVQKKFPELQHQMEQHRQVQLQGRTREVLDALSVSTQR